MQHIATITSKRQLTIPARLFRALSLQEGQKVILSQQDGTLILKPALETIERLAGSVQIPSRYQSLDLEEIIRRAKKEYYHRDV